MIKPDPAVFNSGKILRFEKLRRYFRDGLAPLTVRDGRMGFLTLRPPESLLDKSVSFAEFSAALREEFASNLRYEAARRLADQQPHESARQLLAGRTMARAALFIFIVVCCGLSTPQFASAILILFASAYFLLIAAVRIGLAIAA